MQNHKIQTNERKFFKNISIYKIEKKSLLVGNNQPFAKTSGRSFLIRNTES